MALKIVRDIQTRKDEALLEVRAGETNVKNLMAKYGLSRGHVRGLIAKHGPADKIKLPSRKGLNLVPVVYEAPPPPVLKPTLAEPMPLNAWVLRLGSIALGGVGIILNCQFAISLGQTQLASVLMGVTGVIIDIGTLFLLDSAFGLWERRRFVQCASALAMWLVCFGLSTVAAMSFAAGNIGDSLQGREATVQRRGRLETELAAAKIERWKITEDRNPAAIEQQIQVAQTYVPQVDWKRSGQCGNVTISVTCLDVVRLREAKAHAVRRSELDDKIHALSEQMDALPAIASKDPGADHISSLTAGLFTPNQVEWFRVVGFAFMPSFAGLLLALARTLLL